MKAELSYPELHHLYGELHISQADIENHERIADTKDFQIQAEFLLKRWIQKNGYNATKETILEALHEFRSNRAKHILKKKWGIAEEGRSLCSLYAVPKTIFLPNKVAILLILCYDCLMRFNSMIILSSTTN